MASDRYIVLIKRFINSEKIKNYTHQYMNQPALVHKDNLTLKNYSRFIMESP